MKLKKKYKIILIVLLVIIVGTLAFLGYKKFFGTPAVKEAKVLNTIKDYDYVIKNDDFEKTVQIIMTIIENEKRLENEKVVY